MLRHTELPSIENLPRHSYIVARIGEFFYELVEESAMSADGKSFYVLENEGSGIELRDNTNEFPDQPIAGIVEKAVAD